MDFLVSILLITITLICIQAKQLDTGPQVFNDTTKLLPQISQKRYATKDIIVYLTPSQIRALQGGHGWINPQHIPHVDNEKSVLANAQASAQAKAKAHVLADAQSNAEVYAQANAEAHAFSDAQANAFAKAKQHALANAKAHGGAAAAEAQYAHEEYLNRLLASQQPLKATPVEEPNSDNFVPIIPPPEYRILDNYAYFNFHPPSNPHTPKPAPFIPESQEHSSLRTHKELLLPIPTEPLQQKIPENPLKRENLTEQWYRLLDQNRAHLKALADLSHYHEKLNEHKKDVLKYAPKFNDQKYALDIEHLINHNHQLQLEKQLALLQAEIIANSPPVVIHKEISIKHSPVHLIKQVKVPVPTPVLIPVPEPFEVRIPQPYPVPLENNEPAPIPIANANKIHLEKQAPLERVKHFNFPVTKPYFLELGSPEHKLGGVPVHSHTWKE